MRRACRSSLAVLAALVPLANVAAAQAPDANAKPVPVTSNSAAGALPVQQNSYDAHGIRVEVLGLRHWTLAGLQDTIARRFPGQTLHQDGCMAVLRDSLGFADAQIVRLTIIGGPNAKSSTERRDFLIIKASSHGIPLS